MDERFDLIVVGAGAAGLPAAIFASGRGARVLLIEAADVVGGTFHLSSGQMSAAGTRLQAARGIVDSPDAHFDDVMRISRGTAHRELVRLAVDNAADTLHWLLDHGLEVEPDHPIVHYGHEPYSVARTCWGAEGGRSVLAVIVPLLDRAVAEHGLTVRSATRMVRLVTVDGTVVGVETCDGHGARMIRAEAVLLTSGGATAAPERYAELDGGARLYGGGYAESLGKGSAAAQAAGANVSGGEHFLPTFAAVADPTASGGYTFLTETYPQVRQPWEVYVDLDGNRFVREDDPSVDARERALLAARDMRFWAIYDARVAREAPGFFYIDADMVARRFQEGGAFVSASSLDELAARMAVPADTLNASIARYNKALIAGTPDELGREHRPLPLVEPPFHAVEHVGWSVVTFGGIDIDTQMRVLRRDGKPVAGLYAAGEIIGFAKTSGNSFCGGMSVTPAMTFGRLFGSKFAARRLAQAA